eukprot:2449946-Rhodomonas_salina.3
MQETAILVQTVLRRLLLAFDDGTQPETPLRPYRTCSSIAYVITGRRVASTPNAKSNTISVHTVRGVWSHAIDSAMLGNRGADRVEPPF